MKVFISADIEGTNGISNWDETTSSTVFQNRMTQEVAAVCEGVNEHDPKAFIFVKDAHNNGDNIDHELLPHNVMLNRAFSGHPLNMMNLLDETFDASMLTGYHSAAYTGGNPLAHTLSSSKYSRMILNDSLCSEFHIAYYTSLRFGVPMVMVAGDSLLCKAVKEADSDILTVVTVEGFGKSVTSPHPAITRKELKETAKQAAQNAKNLKPKCKKKLPADFHVELSFHEHYRAFRAAHFPGAGQKDAHTISFSSKDFMDVLRLLVFV